MHRQGIWRSIAWCEEVLCNIGDAKNQKEETGAKAKAVCASESSNEGSCIPTTGCTDQHWLGGITCKSGGWKYGAALWTWQLHTHTEAAKPLVESVFEKNNDRSQ